MKQANKARMPAQTQANHPASQTNQKAKADLKKDRLSKKKKSAKRPAGQKQNQKRIS
ncbi:hypothetical protein [Paraburkholderia terrae]|uniref:hypothetical protein n=1 Tax=Paraburkholderia terrae TaxID=311230 RepID=UPI001E5BB6D6|nr:hypothetical protein [Paraburkholderia terrae]